MPDHPAHHAATAVCRLHPDQQHASQRQDPSGYGHLEAADGTHTGQLSAVEDTGAAPAAQVLQVRVEGKQLRGGWRVVEDHFIQLDKLVEIPGSERPELQIVSIHCSVIPLSF
jgi:hypothetical protein